MSSVFLFILISETYTFFIDLKKYMPWKDWQYLSEKSLTIKKFGQNTSYQNFKIVYL